MDKSAQVNFLDTTKVVIIVLATIVCIAIAGILVGFSLKDADVVETDYSGAFANQTTLAINSSGYYPTGLQVLDECSLTITFATNVTDGSAINSANYSVSGCLLNGSTALAPYLHDEWNISGTYTYVVNHAEDISGNYSSGVADFFSNIPTIFTILFVVVIIGFIALVIIIVNRFGGTKGGL